MKPLTGSNLTRRCSEMSISHRSCSPNGESWCQTWRDVTPAVPSRWYCQCLSPCCLEELVIGNSLCTLARSARRWGGGNVARAEPGTQLEDTPGTLQGR